MENAIHISVALYQKKVLPARIHAQRTRARNSVRRAYFKIRSFRNELVMAVRQKNILLQIGSMGPNGLLSKSQNQTIGQLDKFGIGLPNVAGTTPPSLQYFQVL